MPYVEACRTSFATMSYLSMAHTQEHKPSAALDALAALAGVKSGLEVYSRRILVAKQCGVA